WVFRGLNVRADESFGTPMVGFEIDSRSADSPPGVELIARVELPDRAEGNVLRPCEMIYYERTPAFGFSGPAGGAVFAAGSVNYAMGLMPYYNGWEHLSGQPDRIARGLTRNVLDRLGWRATPPSLTAPN